MVKPFEGVLPVYKPAGFTSHDVVAKMRRILKMKRIGHTGTLDPQVTGVLPLCLGRATRVVEYMQELPKEYLATLRLGLSTDTEDMTGKSLSVLKHRWKSHRIRFNRCLSSFWARSLRYLPCILR